MTIEGAAKLTLTGKQGELDVTGQLAIDSDGAPDRVELTVKWGTFELRRTP